MFARIARAIFGTANDRALKRLQARVPEINALEPQTAALTDAALQARTAEFRERLAKGESLDDLMPEAFATVREAAKRVARPAPFRRPDGRRHGPARRQDRRDEDRRGQDPGRHPAGLPQCPVRQGRPCRHGQRLPGQARRRMDGADLPLPRPDHRRHRAWPDRRGAPRRLCRRRHLRHQQRIRLRLPARQHEVPAGGDGPARLQLRHRRRGRQHPDRRGADAADHQRPVRGQLRPLPPGRRGREGAGRGQDHLRQGREAAHRQPDRYRVRDGRGDAARPRGCWRRATSTTSTT